ncbi:hypothetical protein L2E82_02108 [Cichorium intybus]|uniref:Uncharacterized protein n=1 Tax=Cichorium intybus TaxID=13427 RepID=A0ACB9H0R5_CICIN|nr:hypothetical protein L2E82_02108 [Cichorium intybus]
MAASSAYFLVTRPSPSIPQFTLQSSSFTSHAFCFRSPKNRSRLPVLSMRQETKVSEVTTQSWNTSVLKSETPVLVEFYTNWCGPCQMVHQVIDEIATDYGGKLKRVVVNVDQEPQVAEQYDVKAVPIVILFKNGEKRESVVGSMSKEFFIATIERVLAT